MTPAYSGRLELTWTNKDETLLAREDQSYEWVNPSDYRVSEVRLLRDVLTVGKTKPLTKRACDNLLIRGDALHALNALNRIPEFAREYVGKVKLVYIDPPFNTGQAFEHYDDNLEHSVWLTMLRDRLIQIKDLLAPDGSVWVHLDDTEAHRGRVVLDEVFGADAFVATVVWEKTSGAKGDTGISTSHDLIHVYAPEASRWKKSRNLLSRTTQQLGRYANPDGDPRGPWRQGADGTAKSGNDRLRYEITLPSGRVVKPPKGNYWRFSQETFRKALVEGRVWFGRTGDSLPVIKTYLSSAKQGVVPRTWWSAHEVGSNQEARRDHLRRMFPDLDPFSTPKPERLLKRILEIATNPGDVVLDCYAGSGTTAAVAHKLDRRWVAVEWSAETIATFALPRLTKVVNNEDPDGITSIAVPSGDGLPETVRAGAATDAAKTIAALDKAGLLNCIDKNSLTAMVKALRDLERTTKKVMWSGGGGFRVLDVGRSMFEEADGRIYLADWAVNGALSEAVAAQFGYDYSEDGPFCGTKGKTRLAVVDGLVNESVIRLLDSVLPDGQKMLVCGTAVDPYCRSVLKELRHGSSLKKIPAALINEYRSGRRELLALTSVLNWVDADRMVNPPVRHVLAGASR